MRKYHEEMVSYFVKDVQIFADSAESAVASMLAGDRSDDNLDAAIRAVHALRGAAGLFKQLEIFEIAGCSEDLLEVAKSFLGVDEERFDSICRLVSDSFPILRTLSDAIESPGADKAKILREYREKVRSEYGDYLDVSRRDVGDLDLGALDDVDPELIACFIDEADELFDALERNAEALQGNREDSEALLGVSRAFHTLKSAAGLANVDRIQMVADRQQQVLEDLIDEGGSVSSAELDGIWRAIAQIEECLRAVKDAKRSDVQGGNDAGAGSVDSDLIDVFLEECEPYLDEIETIVLDAEPISREHMDRIRRLFHTIKGSAGLVGLEVTSDLAAETYEFISATCERDEVDSPEIREVVRSALERINESLASATEGESRPEATDSAELDAATPMRSNSSGEDDLQFFLADVAENLDEFVQAALRLEKDPSDLDQVAVMFRAIHTIKGASTMVGLETIGRVAGSLEDLLESLAEGSTSSVSSEFVDLMLSGVDHIQEELARATGVDPDSSGSIEEFEKSIARELKRVSGSPIAVRSQLGESETWEECEADEEEEAGNLPGARSDLDSRSEPGDRAPKPVTERTGPSKPTERTSRERRVIRVEADRVDTLMNLVAELITTRTRLANRIKDLTAIRDELTTRKDHLIDLVNQFQIKYEFGTKISGSINARAQQFDGDQQFSELEFDRYDDFNILCRGLLEITTDVSEIMTQLDHFFLEVGEESTAFAKVSSTIQREVTQLRMIPASAVLERLRRPIRDAARREGKEVELTLSGGDAELDKAIVDRLFEPLLHLVRNAVSHGIEDPKSRVGLKKPRSGSLLLRAFQEGGAFGLEVVDDGGGVDLAAVRARGVELGYLPGSGQPTKEELLELMFRPGFSTRSTVNDVSGRGVGLDAVAAAIRDINGTISVQTVEGRGSRFLIRVPLTLAVNEALLVQSGGETFALPLNYVEEAMVVDPRRIELVSGNEILRIRGAVVPLLRLDGLFGLHCSPSEAVNAEGRTAVIVTLDDRRVAVLVDRVIARQEIVVKTNGEFMKNLRHLSGATIGGDGRVSFIVDVPSVIGSDVQLVGDQAAIRDLEIDGTPESTTSPGAAETRRRILVADDSISVRKVASRLLGDAGYEVDLAVDGLNALEFLRANRYLALVTDLEMPQMHGYELIAEIRRTQEISDLPIIVVSSRSGQKHVRRAFELGANAYLGKPFTQTELLGQVEKLTEDRVLS